MSMSMAGGRGDRARKAAAAQISSHHYIPQARALGATKSPDPEMQPKLQLDKTPKMGRDFTMIAMTIYGIDATVSATHQGEIFLSSKKFWRQKKQFCSYFPKMCICD